MVARVARVGADYDCNCRVARVARVGADYNRNCNRNHTKLEV